MKVFAVSCLLAMAAAAPAPEADAEADPQYFGTPLAYHAGPAPNCVTDEVLLVTQVCTPTAEEVCTKETIDTEEIEYEKVCKEIVDTICDAPAAPIVAAGYHAIGKREAEADAQYLAGYPYAAHAPLVAHAAIAPVAAHAVAHSVSATVKHACREVTTEHCVDNPKIIAVPVEVEHCHTVTKVTCADVENKLPKTTCEAVVTNHVSHAAYYGKK